jgi:lipopolysaccharide/colanic/teichoic acid biosynthesis glycosyltransferase
MPDLRGGQQPATPAGFTWQVKRIMDAAVAAIGLLLLAPLLLLLGLLIVLESGWPPLFTQTRVGGGGRCFRLYKFRTMVLGAQEIGAGLYFEPDDPRITHLGRFLRRYSLDEVPQLWNVLVGDESLVGPRAMVPEIAEKLDPGQELRHRVRPGITGLAQINGRNTLTWSQRVVLDNRYIDNWSLLLDLRILALTVPTVLTSAGVRVDQGAADVDDLGR